MLPERRSSFVLNTTISELILLLFFLVLLLLVYANSRTADLEKAHMADEARAKESERQTAELQARVQRLQVFYDQIVAKLPPAQRDQVADTLVAIDKLRATLAELDKNKSDLEKDILAQETLIAYLAKNVPIDKVPNEMRKEIGDLALCKQATVELPAVRTTIQGLKTDNANLRGIAKEATAKAARCGGRGEEYVACWRDPSTNQIQFVFDVFLENGRLRVGHRWPGGRDQEMSRFPSEQALVGQVLTLEAFLRDTQAMFDQSLRDSCRHYVVIHGDRSKMDAAMFAQYIRVQDHFYHLPNIK